MTFKSQHIKPGLMCISKTDKRSSQEYIDLILDENNSLLVEIERCNPGDVQAVRQTFKIISTQFVKNFFKDQVLTKYWVNYFRI